MPRIIESIEIKAPLSKVWEIVSDLDNEREYWWGTREVKNLSKEGNVINREVYQNFRNHAILQKAIVKPQKEIEIQYLKGLTEGVKYLRITSHSDEEQTLEAEWIVHFPGIFFLATPFIARHVWQGTKDALRRVKDAAEGRSIERAECIASGDRE
ncbi:MAG TPA: SRPBCC family protein [Nitrososphaerales archaeon]|nr:SRPBCC family protein [Nitrososphaerales archaeon]